MDLEKVLANYKENLDFLLEWNDESQSYSNLDKEYLELKEFGFSICGSSLYPCKIGALPVNKPKNRYRDILPFDATRVKLNEIHGIEGSDYINASYIKGVGSKTAYIAAQAPTPLTVKDFWRMILERGCTVIVMACNEKEGNKVKCERYWPKDNEEAMKFGKILVYLKSVETRDDGDFIIRRLHVTDDTTSRTVMHYQYVAWPDHGIPRTIIPIIDLITSVRAYQAGDTPPILVHCSAGCGRTGTLITVDYIWNLLKQDLIKDDIRVIDVLKELRKQRQALVQTVDQYEVVLKCVEEVLKQQCQFSNHAYDNVDLKSELPTDHQSMRELSDIASLLMTVENSDSTPLDENNPQCSSTVAPSTHEIRILIHPEKNDRKYVNQYENVDSPSTSSEAGKNDTTRSAESGCGRTRPLLPAKPVSSTRHPSPKKEQKNLWKSHSADDNTSYHGFSGEVKPVRPTELDSSTAMDQYSVLEPDLTTGNRSSSSYSYVDPTACSRWHQGLARGYTLPERGYSNHQRFIGIERNSDKTVYSIADHGTQPPPVPVKTHAAYMDVNDDSAYCVANFSESNTDNHNEQVSNKETKEPSAGAKVLKDNVIGKLKTAPLRIKGLKLPSKSASPVAEIATQQQVEITPHQQVIYAGCDVSYPNRLPRLTGEKSMPQAFK